MAVAHAFNGQFTAAYPPPLLKEQGMTHILTVAMDLNATLRELPGLALERELSEAIRAEGVTHVTLLAEPPSRLPFGRKASLADQLLKAHPHLDIHLVARRSG